MEKTRIFEGMQYILEFDGKDIDVYTQQPLTDENGTPQEDAPWICNCSIPQPFSHELISRIRALEGQLIAGYLIESLLTGFGLGLRYGRDDNRIIMP